MFERNALHQLKKWAKKDNRKPLILRGARQVGKTTLVNQFAKEFDTYLYLNLENKEALDLFESEASVETTLIAIYLLCGKQRTKGKTLLFIDEIQNSPKAIAKLRYFYEEAPEIFVIAAGSLLETMMGTHISFPVGRVEYMALRPCNFVEFLRATGEEVLVDAIEKSAIPEPVHGKVMDLFNTYVLLGGMPEIVAHYAKHKDLVALNDIYETLLTGYKEDVEKYARNTTMTHVIRYILQEGWSYVAQRITLGNFAGSSYKAREMGEAFRTLEKTLLLELVYPTTRCVLPISPDLKRAPKLLWIDSGLVNYAANIQQEVFGAKDIFDAWRGNVAEQIVAQELLAIDNKVSTKRKFWVRDKQGADAEVDFIIQHNGHVIPIEVKSGVNAKLKSLHIFMENTDHDIAVRIWSNPFSIDKVKTATGKEFRLFNIPFYYVGNIDKLIKITE